MPKASIGVGRKECMDAMCQSCGKANTTPFYGESRTDCRDEMCPLYPFMPYGRVQREARNGQPHIRYPWGKLNPKSIGYAPRKGVSHEEYVDAVKLVDEYVFRGGPRPTLVEQSMPALEPEELPDTVSTDTDPLAGLGW